MEVYRELRTRGTHQWMGYVKVVRSNVTDYNSTVVTINGNNFFTLGSVHGELNPIVISEDVLLQAGFCQVDSNYRITMGQSDSIYRVLYNNGSFVEIMYNGREFFYLIPDSNRLEGCVKLPINTIEQLQSEVYVHEGAFLILSLLNTEINKSKLKEALLSSLSPDYQANEGPNNGRFIDNNPERPDYEYIRMEPIDRNANPADIIIGAFQGNSCTITVHIFGVCFHYRYGANYQQLQENYPNLQQIFTQYAGHLRCLFDRANEAINYSLTC